MYSTKNTKANKSLIIHIVLLVFLGKIWMWPWIYQTAYSLKTIKPNDYSRRPGGQLLMYMFIPFYFMYWFYKSGKILSNCASRNGVRIEIAGLCCVLSLFSRRAACIILQMESDKLEEALLQKEAEAKDQKEEKNATAKESNSLVKEAYSTVTTQAQAKVVTIPDKTLTKSIDTAESVKQTPEREVKKERSTPKSNPQMRLKYSLTFETDQGTKRYLLSILDSLNPSERAAIERIKDLEPKDFKEAVRKLVNEQG